MRKQTTIVVTGALRVKLVDVSILQMIIFFLTLLTHVTRMRNVRNERLAFVLHTKMLGPAVQSIVILTSSLVVKMLAVLVSTISNSHVFLLENVSSF